MKPTLSTVAIESPSSQRRRRGQHHNHQHHRQHPDTKRRQGSSLTRPNEAAANAGIGSSSGGEDNEYMMAENRKKQRRTRSIDRVIGSSGGGGGITAITTLQIGQNGEPITVTSEIQHQNPQDLVPTAPPSSLVQPTPNKNRLDMAYVPVEKVTTLFLVNSHSDSTK